MTAAALPPGPAGPPGPPPAASAPAGWPLLARWQADAAPARFAGHFPGQPILPGAWLLDAVIAQVQAHSGLAVLQVRDARFTQAAAPGTPLALHALIAPPLARFALLGAQGPLCSGSLTLGQPPATPPPPAAPAHAPG